MPSGVLKLIGVLLLVGSIGVIGVQACTTKAPRSFAAIGSPAAAAAMAPAPASPRHAAPHG